MDYNTLLNELSAILDGEFNIDTFYEIKKLYVYMMRTYREELEKKKSDYKKCLIEFDKYMTIFRNMVWSKIKESLGFSIDVTNRIASFILSSDRIEDIYVINDTVFVKNDNEENPLLTSPEYNYSSITSEKFIGDNKKHGMTNLVVYSINNMLKSIIMNEDFVDIENDKIIYKAPVNIYINRTIADIKSDQTGTKVTNVLVTYGDEVLFLEMKNRSGYITIYESLSPLQVVSHMLDEKNNQKK